MDNISQAEIYRAAKNVIHNDLGITKEYIDEVIKDTVKKEINLLMGDDCFIRGLVEKEVLKSIGKKSDKNWHILHDCSNWISEEINSVLLETISKKIEIRLKDDDYEGKTTPVEPVQLPNGHYMIKHKTGEGD